MDPLMFVDWAKLHVWFRNLMWAVLVLALLLIMIFATAHPVTDNSRDHLPLGNPRVAAPR